MARNHKPAEEKGAIDLVEEAFHLLRQAPATAWAACLAGTLPFALGLLFFWSEMSQSGYAWRHEPAAVLGMTLLFFWLKGWQTVFARKLLEQFIHREGVPWTGRRVLRMVVQQSTCQAFALFALPVAAVILVPMGWVFAYYQSYTVLGDGSGANLAEASKQARVCARLWPRQNHLLLGILSVLGFFIFLNWISAFVVVPQLMKSFMGIESMFTRSSGAYLNTTFLMAMVVLTWLCLDPFIKAIYVLRCFYGSARASGEDLRVELRHTRPPVLATLLAALLLLEACGTVLQAATPEPRPSAAPPAQLDRAISEVLEQRKYTWRIPKEQMPKPPPETDTNFIVKWCNRIGDTISGWFRGLGNSLDGFGKWLDKLFGNRNLPKPPKPTGDNLQVDWFSPLRVLLVILLVALAGVLGFFIWKMWKRRRPPMPDPIPETVPAAPDLTNEYVAANALPEDEWLVMARDLVNQGELRLALRAYYLANLAHLAQRQLLSIARFKSNRDYERELARRAHALPRLPGLFHENVLMFERVWYGLHETTAEMLAEYAARVEQLRSA
jgi:hypothetical protein